jgi:5-methyltetrahydrofolate--homocysteine methyltransferase
MPAKDANPFLALLAGGGPIVVDGAMGTELLRAGGGTGERFETWVLDPARAPLVAAVHRAYRDAGAQVVLANSFGANPLRLALPPDRVIEVARAAASLARDAVGPGTVVAGSVGPTGSLLEPYGELSVAAARDAFAAAISGLATGGVDVIWIETMSDLEEVRAALAAAAEVAPGLPVVTTLTFERGRTMMGTRPEEAASALAGLGVAAVGANCGNGFEEVEAVLPGLVAGAPGLAVVAKANAGRPLLTADGAVAYPGTPDEAAGHARRALAAGARIVGGCCGTTPGHIAAVAAALAEPPSRA